MANKKMPIYDYETGIFYDSIREAAEYLKVSERRIYEMLSSGRVVNGHKLARCKMDPRDRTVKEQVQDIFRKCYKYVYSITEGAQETKREYTISTDQFFMELHGYLERQYEMEAFEEEKRAREEEEQKKLPPLEMMFGK